jgi:hypothetical protein
MGGDPESVGDKSIGSVEAPAGAGDVHAIFHEVATGAFDHAGRDRPAVLERGGVVEVGALVEEVGRAAVRVLAFLRVEVEVGRFAGDRAGDDPGFAGGDLGGLVLHPFLGFRVHDVDQVDQDRDLDLAGLGLLLDAVDLVAVPVHEREDRALVVGVASVGLLEHVGQELR